MKLRAYFSAQHLWAANHFTAMAEEIEHDQAGAQRFDIRHRSLVTNAIFSSAAFLEAAINELFQDAYDEHLAYIAPLDPGMRESIGEFWKFIGEHNVQSRSRFGTHEKYQIALTLTQNEGFDTDSPLYQNTRLVIKLQNALVHYKPSAMVNLDRDTFETDLHGKFALNPMMIHSENPFFPDKCLSQGCAAWAVNSCRDFADEFFNTLGISPNYRQIDFDRAP